MKLQRALHQFLRQHFPADVRQEPWCTCGSPNHVRIRLFRVNGQPATAVIPEGCELSPLQFSRALPGARVDPLDESELAAIYAANELGRPQPFENPFGTAVYLDENLLHFQTLVFCPRMFSGQKGECFRVPVQDFRELVRAVILPLYPTFLPAAEA